MKTYIIFLFLIIVLFIPGCTEQDTFIVGSVLNLNLSSDAYLEINGEAQPMPINISKIGEEYGYCLNNISDLGLNNVSNLKIIDNGKIVYEFNSTDKKCGFSYNNLLDNKDKN